MVCRLNSTVKAIYGYLIRVLLKFTHISVSQTEYPLISYAGTVPSLKNISFGGKVKLHLLNQVFPEQGNNFNILYLVSSGLTIFAKEFFKKARNSRAKIVWNQNGVAYPAWAGEGFELVNKPMREHLQASDFVIYQSAFCKLSADKYLGVYKGLYAIVYNCVDTEIFRPKDNKPESGCLHLLLCGSHEQPGRVLSAIETTSILHKKGVKVHLEIAGRLAWDNASIRMKKLAEDLGIAGCIEITGPYLQDKAPAIYSSSDILLHLKYNDPCPSVVIEAMACGLPVVCSRSGGTPELIGDKAGIALEVPCGWEKEYFPDTNAIVEAVRGIMKDRKAYSSAARSRAVELFDKKLWISKHKEIFESILERS